MSAQSATAQPHIDIVGTDTTNVHNFPGAEKAASGHMYTAAQPIGGMPQRRSAGPATPNLESRDDVQNRFHPLGAGQPLPDQHAHTPSQSPARTYGTAAAQQRTVEAGATQPREHQPRPEEHVPHAYQAPRPLGQNIREIIPGDAHPSPAPTPPGLPALSTPVIDEDASAPRVTALDTLTGATSAELDRGPGHPAADLSDRQAVRDAKMHGIL
ncbi:hypothetical protein BV25DRAFT_1914017 [Artomyces pyxidatus]|uniref:Uncharacterized protein n=1 Tax=Artomyces pyxidatus TaxID=48021 RepID=A0ACB8T8T7_9AGAM|nr:hypothetical protein BV25DRAFT_1914017 [Artomyces pyxidatus]